MNVRLFSTLSMLVLLATIFFGCQKSKDDEGPGTKIICYFGPPSCTPVKYISTGSTTATGCQDLVQFLDPAFISGYSGAMDTLRLPRINADGSVDNTVHTTYPNVMSISRIPDEFKNGETFYVKVATIDPTDFQTAICIWTRYTFKYSEIGRTQCVPSGPKQ